MVHLSRERALSVYKQDQRPIVPSQHTSHAISWQDFQASEFDTVAKSITYYTKAKRAEFIDEVCVNAWKAARNHDLESLDGCFTELLTVEWRPESVSEDELIESLLNYLSRIPDHAQPLPNDGIDLPPVTHQANTGSDDKDNLNVTNFVSTNLVRLSIYRVFTRLEPKAGWITQTVQDIINDIGEYIDIVVKKQQSAKLEDRSAWKLVRLYLWSFWQLTRTALAADVLRIHVRLGFSHQDDKLLWFRNFHVAPGITLMAFTEHTAVLHKPPNMCSWALELLRTDPFCLGLNFNVFHERMKSISSGWPCRCRKDSIEPCDGMHSDNCLRYKGAIVEEQSMHDHSCDIRSSSESKLKWQKKSYEVVDGPRAVDIEASTNSTLMYCLASKDTVAISHVWSHGQGGRPENGINTCLHKRYIEVARSIGCNSYWMDTTCIPEDHNLRKEAIEQINQVFYNSRAIVVCDRELMDIDVENMTVEKQESILCAIMMSDWNVRAWTILEGLKGRENIYVLCKDNKLLNLKSVLDGVVEYGRYDICAFGHLLSHLLPSTRHGIEPKWRTALPTEVAGAWLSHRPASRPGDDIIIWSLLLAAESKPVANALEFWKGQKSIYSGYLLSSAARLKEPGFSWAPSTPYAVPSKIPSKPGKLQTAVDKFHRPLSSMETVVAKITPIGLASTWYAFEFNVDNPLLAALKIDTSMGGKHGNALDKLPDETTAELNKIRKEFFRFNSKFSRGSMGKLLRPISHTVHFRFDGAAATPSPGKDGILLAICESTGRDIVDVTKDTERQLTDMKRGEWSYKWFWRGVYEWPGNVPLPPMDEDQWVLIA